MEMYRILKLWRFQDSVNLCALFHNAYNLNLPIFNPPATREAVRSLVGEAAERLIHLFSLVLRLPFIHGSLLSHYTDSELVEHLKYSEISLLNAKVKGLFSEEKGWKKKIRSLVPPDGLVVKRIKTGEDVRIPRRVATMILVMIMADYSDQLYGFQDDLFGNFNGKLQFEGMLLRFGQGTASQGFG